MADAAASNAVRTRLLARPETNASAISWSFHLEGAPRPAGRRSSPAARLAERCVGIAPSASCGLHSAPSSRRVEPGWFVLVARRRIESCEAARSRHNFGG